MYAVIKTGGKQYRVTAGDSVRVATLASEVGSDIEFSSLLAVSNDTGEFLTGDAIKDAKVVATVAKHGRGDKVIVFKFKRKKQYRRTMGHRQDFTQLTVKEVVI